MTKIDDTLVERSMQVAARMAKSWRLGPDETCDAISLAWEFAQVGRGTPTTIAWYAIKRVRSNRRFRESVRSIDSPVRHLLRDPIDPVELVDSGPNPASNAALRIDFEEWVASLPDRPRQIALSLATGDGTGELAERFGCSSSRISQIRRELESHWFEFHG